MWTARSICLVILVAAHTTQLSSADGIPPSQVRLRQYMARVEQIAAKDGPVPITPNYLDPFAQAICKSEDMAEDGKYAEAAQVLSSLMNGQMADDWKQMLQTRIGILKKWHASGHIELSDYRAFFLETGPQWFHNRTRPISALWKKEIGPEVKRYFLIAALLAARRDSEGQVLVLSAIPDLNGVSKDAAADALLAAGNVLRESGDFSGAETNWSKVTSRYVGSRAWPEAVFNLGILCKEKKRYMEAITFFNTLLESKSMDTARYRDYLHSSALELSQCYEALGDYANSLKWAREAQIKYPSQPDCPTCARE